MFTHDQFTADVESFLSKTGVAATRLGREAIGDPNFVLDIRAGRVPTLKTAERILNWISAFPAGCPAPSTQSIDLSERSGTSPEVSGNHPEGAS